MNAAARVHLLALDADLAERVPAGERPHAVRAVTVPAFEVDPGPWAPSGAGHGLLVLRGRARHGLELAGREAIELFGPGDVLRPVEAGSSLLPCSSRWRVLEPLTVAVLGQAFAQAVQRWPGLGRVITDRLLQQAHRASLRGAILQLPRIEQRVLAMLWHLADRWGRVTSAGVVVPVALTHAELGRLVGGRRPSVSLAIKELEDLGHVTRLPGAAGWRLAQDSREVLAAPAPQVVELAGLTPAEALRARPRARGSAS